MHRSTPTVCALLFGLSFVSLCGLAHAEEEGPKSNVLRSAEKEGPELGSPRVAFREQVDAIFSRLSNPLREPSTLDDTESKSDGLRSESTETKPESAKAELEPTETKPEATDAEPELSAEMKALRDKVRRSLDHYYQRPVSIGNHSPWGIMHALISYGVDTQVYAGNKKVNAIGLLCYNTSCRGQRLFYVDGGKLQARQGPGVQGHHGQFLAMLAQSHVKSTYPIRAGSSKFTVADLVEHEKLTCKAGTELTFKLIGLMHYLDSDATWKDRRGEEWNMERLLKEELAQPVIGAACGGTHRMMGFSYAVRLREQRGEPFTGQWLRTKKFVEAYHKYTFKLQNEDGSFSTNFFKGRGNWGNNALRLESTGHILEWLVYSLPEEQLQDPRVIKAVNYLADLMWENRRAQWAIGPKGHALHALVLYDQRVFGAKAGQGGPKVVRSEKPADEG